MGIFDDFLKYKKIIYLELVDINGNSIMNENNSYLKIGGKKGRLIRIFIGDSSRSTEKDPFNSKVTNNHEGRVKIFPDKSGNDSIGIIVPNDINIEPYLNPNNNTNLYNKFTKKELYELIDFCNTNRELIILLTKNSSINGIKDKMEQIIIQYNNK